MNILDSREITNPTIDLASLRAETNKNNVRTEEIKGSGNNSTGAARYNGRQNTSRRTRNYQGRGYRRFEGYRGTQQYNGRRQDFRYNTQYRPRLFTYRRNNMELVPLGIRLQARLKRECERDMLDMRQVDRLKPDKEKLFKELATKLCKHHLESITIPESKFWTFVQKKRAEGVQGTLREIRKQWESLPHPAQKLEIEWKDNERLLKDYRAFETRRLELLNPLRELLGKPKVLGSLDFKKGIEFFYEDIKSTIEESIKGKNAYEREKVLKDEWAKLSWEKRILYLALSWKDKENARHWAEMSRLNDYLRLAEAYAEEQSTEANSA